jgi:rare lipoprotein A
MNGRHNVISAVLTFIAVASFSSSLMAAPQTGIASVYSGERTANGEYASASALTAAHRSLPFGTMVEVTNTRTGRSVVVRINDRGPFVRGRVIDLTPAGARAIGCSGLAPVRLTVLADATPRAGRSVGSIGG